MSNAIILHGRPPKAEYYAEEFPTMSNSHWLPWLQKQLVVRNIFADTPEIPLSYEPKWDLWVKEVERYEIRSDTVLVGHSCGGGFWARYLSDHPELTVGRVVLVAPWIDVEQEDPNHFFDFEIDPYISRRTKGLTIFNSTNDAPEIQSSVAKLRQTLKNIEYKEFDKRGHFTHKDMPDDKFPEVLEEIIN